MAVLNLLDRLYNRSHLGFAIAWIVAYVLAASYADAASQSLGTIKLVTAPVLLAMSALLLAWARHANAQKLLFLGAPSTAPVRMFFYLPLAIVATKKLWLGATLGGTPVECACWVASMIAVGFLEELIFRGLLFRAIEENSRTQAIVISSLTFGIGHIVNLFNTSGQGLLLTLAQIVFAVSVGFMLVEVMLKSGSIWPPVVFHMVNNALSIFEDEAAGLAFFGSDTVAVIASVGTGALVSLAYALYLAKALPDADSPQQGQYVHIAPELR